MLALMVGTLAFAAFAPVSTVSAAPKVCAAPEMVPGLGLACPAPGGWLVTLASGQTVFTHGFDAIPAARPHLSLPDPGVACVGEDEPHFRILYLLPRLAPVVTAATGYAVAKPQIVAGVLNANAIVYANAMKFGVPMRLKVLCDEAGLPRVDAVTLSIMSSQAHFGSITSDLEARGYGNEVEKVLAFYEGRVDCGGCGGQSTIPGGDSPSEFNPNNNGWNSYSYVYMLNYGTPAWVTDEVILHEVTHALGGVQDSAPNSSGNAHCNDGWDIMCYSDGGRKSEYRTNCHVVGHSYVGAAMPYDCGNDDYFHPDPAPGSYLDTHWNVARNRFLARG